MKRAFACVLLAATISTVSPSAVALPRVVLTPYEHTYTFRGFCLSGTSVRVHETGSIGFAEEITRQGSYTFRGQEHLVGRAINLDTGKEARYASNDQIWFSGPPGAELEVGDTLVSHFSGLNFLVKKERGGIIRTSGGAAIFRTVVTEVEDGDAAFESVVAVETPHLVHADEFLFPAISNAVC